jgi:hypothetical protein
MNSAIVDTDVTQGRVARMTYRKQVDARSVAGWNGLLVKTRYAAFQERLESSLGQTTITAIVHLQVLILRPRF